MKKISIILLFFAIVFGIIAVQRDDVDEASEESSETIDETSETPSANYSSKQNSINNDAPDLSSNETDNESIISGIEIPSPLSDRPEQIIEHTGYTLSYNKSHNTPNWSAWVLTSEKTMGTIPRCKKFWADESVPASCRVDYYEYKGSGYDRGHMCPAGDMKWSADAMHDCFYMTNMCPQDNSLNGGSWKDLEEACREWALVEGTLYIVCGPVYNGSRHEQIGIEHAIDVPEGFFKVVLSLRKGHEKAIGFYYTNTSKNQSINSTATSVDKIEEITGIDFYSSLDDKTENALECTFSVSYWR